MSGGAPFTEKEDAFIVEARKNDMTWAQIGAKLGRHPGGIKNRYFTKLKYMKETLENSQKIKSELRLEQEKKAKDFENKVILAIRDSIDKFNEPQLKVKPIKAEGRHLVTPVLHTTDKHHGQIPLDVMHRKFEMLTQKVILILQDQPKRYYFEKMHIFNTGDNVEGEDLFPTQPHEINLPMLDQLSMGARIEADMISAIHKQFPWVVIEYDAVPGNHGRVGMRYAEETNWDCIYYIILESHFKNCEWFKMRWTRAFDMVVEVQGEQHMIWHGDNINCALQTPIYGINAAVANYVSDMIEQYPKLKYFHLGHFHVDGSWDWNARVISMGGCMPYGNAWVRKRIKRRPSQSQPLHIYNSVREINRYKIEVKLDDAEACHTNS